MDETNFAAGKVVTGFSKPYVALYSASGGEPVYSNGMALARGVSISPEIETQGEDNDFYANNVVAESAPQRFRRGTLALTVDGLLRKAEDFIMGLSAKSTVTVGETTANLYDYDDTQKIPYVGLGVVVRYMSNGIESFVPHIYTKTRFAQFTVSAATEEDEIDWQTTELSAALHRDDSPKHRWQRVGDGFETEMEAENVIRAVFKMPILPGTEASAAAAVANGEDNNDRP